MEETKSDYAYGKVGEGIFDRDNVLKITDDAQFMALGQAILSRMMKVKAYISLARATALFAFQGFNPYIIAGRLYQESIRNRRPDFVGDLNFLIVLYLTRGSTIVQPAKYGRSSAAGKAQIETLVKAYSLKAHAANDSAAITLPRIAACFPHLTCSFLHEGAGRVTGKVARGYRAICSPQAPAIIPSTWKNMREVNLKWCETFNKTIKATFDRDRQVQYYDTISRGSYFSDDMRVAIMAKMGIMGDVPEVDKIVWEDDAAGGVGAQVLPPSDELLPKQNFPEAPVSVAPEVSVVAPSKKAVQ